MLSNSIDIVYDKVNGWWETAVSMFPNFIVAIIVLVIFYLIAKYIKHLLKKFFQKFYGQSAVINLFSNIVYLSVLTAGLFVALDILDLDKTVTSMLAGLGILGLALGFAFQEIASNFISGIILSINKPFTIGDIIEVDGNTGTVEFVSLRTTNIRTFQGQKILIPNKTIFQNAITNYTENGKRRVDLEVGVSYGDDLEKVQKVTLEAINSLDDILKEEAVQFFFTDYGDSSINFVVMFWTEYKKKHSEYMEAKHRAIMAINKAFNANDISIPFPIRTLDFGIKGGEKLSTVIKNTPLTLNKDKGE
ncbi:MAG: mechanosensitive ion channel [Candidatus Kapaibacterium sp.]|nr:mechanosensitive ion channel [Ignavibacteriota bacterium]